MSVLTVIQRHCQLHALAIPTSVVSSTDTQVVQLLAVLQEALDQMVLESKFQVRTLECLHTLTAAEDQGSIATIAGNGYQAANFETFFDRTMKRPLYGPLNDTEWQEIKALPNPGPFYKFRIRGGNLLINPTPTAPLSQIAFEFMSSWAITSSAGTPKQLITDDGDGFAFPETMVRQWLKFMWKHTKGLPYQADEKKAYDLLNNYIATDKVKRRINVAYPDETTIKPGVFVPTGNWMQ
jgi:hypothetical protein